MVSITKEELKSIVELANVVPEDYRQKCFELLLSHALGAAPRTPPPAPTPPSPAPPAGESQQKPFVLPIDVKAFLNQYGLAEPLLWKCFHVEGSEIRPIYHLKTHKKARAQIEHALMIALESGMTSGYFEVALDTLRTRCKEYKCYDSPNFSKILKMNSKLFKSVENDQSLSLSPDGKSELAELLESLKD